MASNKHTIEIAGQAVDVPAWASEEQLKELIAIDKGALASLNAMLKDNKSHTRAQISRNEKLLNDLKKSVDKAASDPKDVETGIFKSLKDLLSVNKVQAAAAKKNKQINEAAVKNLNNAVENMGSNISKSTANLAKGVEKADLKGIATAIGSVVGMGTAAGFAIGMLEGFAKNIATLQNTGVGLGTSLQDLRNDASAAGLDLASYGKIINGNSRAINALGATTDEGARSFALLSQQLRGTARDFGQFGLSNTEYNEILAEEIDIRRRGGMSQAQITASVSNSMNNLMKETTMLAAVTGQDRREMLRNRSDILSDPIIESALRAFEGMDAELARGNLGNLGAIMGGFGEEGKLFAGAIARSATTGMDLYQGELGRALVGMTSIGGTQMQNAFRDISDFATNNLDMDTELFNTKITAMFSGLDGIMTDRQEKQLQIQANNGDAGAKSLLTLISGLSGVVATEEAIANARRDTETGLKNNELAGIPAAMEDAANAIKASTLNTVIGGTLNLIGADIEDAGSALVDGIRSIGDRFGPGKGLFEGIGLGGTITIAGMAALAVAVPVLTAAVSALTVKMTLGSFGGGLGGDIIPGGDDADRNRRNRNARVRGGRFGRGILGRVLGVGATAGGFLLDKFRGAPSAVANAGGAVANTAKNAVTPAARGLSGQFIARRFAPVAALLGTIDAIGALNNDELSGREKSEEVGESAGMVGGGIAGAAVGAAVGSVVPVIGTAIGGIVGGIIGSLGGQFAGGKVGEVIGETGVFDSEIDQLNTDINDTTKEIDDLKARIDRSLADQNEFWGNEEGGQRKAQREITKLEEHLATLREKSQSAVAIEMADTNKEISRLQERIKRSEAGEDEFWGGEVHGRRDTAEEIKRLQERLATLEPMNAAIEAMAAEVRLAAEVTATNEVTPVVEPVTPVVEPITPVVEPITPVVEPITPVVEPVTPVVEPVTPVVTPVDVVIPPAKPATQVSTILGTQKKLLEQQTKVNRLVENFKERKGPTEVIGQKDDGFGEMVDVHGYKDADTQASYERLQANAAAAERRLRKIERDDRYKTARASELAKQMNVDTGDGNIKFTAEGHVPTSINGKAVDENLLTEREKQKINRAAEIRDMMNGTKPSPSISTDTTLQPQPEDNKNDQSSLNPIKPDPMTSDQGEAMVAALKENNRLLRKQTDTIESNA